MKTNSSIFNGSCKFWAAMALHIKGNLFTLKTLWVMVNIVFTTFLTVQLVHIFERYIRPQTTQTWEEKVPIKDLEFPLVLKICVIPGFNQTALQELGYRDTFAYFVGLDDPEGDSLLYGWAGHSEDSGTFGTVEDVFAKISNYQIENIVQDVYVWADDKQIKIDLDYLSSLRVNYPHNCHSLILSDVPELVGKNIQSLYLYVNDLKNHDMHVNFKGHTLYCRHNIKEHSFDSIGDDIIIQQENITKSFLVEIAQRQFVEEDPTNDCRNYPNQEYASYEKCDNQFVRNTLPGLTPIWMSENFSAVSTNVYDANDTYGEWLEM